MYECASDFVIDLMQSNCILNTFAYILILMISNADSLFLHTVGCMPPISINYNIAHFHSSLSHFLISTFPISHFLVLN